MHTDAEASVVDAARLRGIPTQYFSSRALYAAAAGSHAPSQR